MSFGVKESIVGLLTRVIITDTFLSDPSTPHFQSDGKLSPFKHILVVLPFCSTLYHGF